VALAVQDIMTAPWASAEGLPDLVRQTATWRPKVVGDWSDQVGQAGAFLIPLTARDLLARCSAWAARAPGLGGYLRETLTAALGDAQPTQQQEERLRRYETQFAQALEASSPLVRMDPSYRARYLQGGNAAYAPLISLIPLNPATPAYELTRELLLRHSSMTEEKLDVLFSPTGPSDIEFTTFLNSPCHPIGFASLMEPIQRDWREKRVNPVQRASFARWRRARPLPRAVALPQEIRRRLIRGWLVACLLNGKPELVEDKGVSLQLRINDDDPAPAVFPLLGEVPSAEDPLDSLAAVLESFCLVFIDALDPTTSTVDSYRRLLAVDIDHAVHPVADLERGFAALAQEIETRLPAALPTPVTRLWELRDDLRLVIDDLRRQLNGRAG
jgi:hypothetical protein